LHEHAEPDLNRAAFAATTHCLTGCAIGEVVGMAIATAAGWGNLASIVVSVALAFFFGYSLTLWPVLRAGLSLRQATGVALAADTVSIAIMEAVDNGFVLVVPGALAAGLGREPVADRPWQGPRGHARVPPPLRRNLRTVSNRHVQGTVPRSCLQPARPRVSPAS
jgi:hypothetical protein